MPRPEYGQPLVRCNLKSRSHACNPPVNPRDLRLVKVLRRPPIYPTNLAEPMLHITTLHGLWAMVRRVREMVSIRNRSSNIRIREIACNGWWVGSPENREDHSRPQSPKLPPTSAVPSPGARSGATSKNTNLKGLTSFIVRNVSNNVASEDRRAAVLTPRTITSSENTGDVIVENTSMTIVWRASARLKSPAQSWICRDRRTLSRDRLNAGNGRESTPVHHQLESLGGPMLNYSPPGPSVALNRSVSRVSAHASNRTGAHPPTLYRSI
jgi:hypothetical protein